MDASVFCDNCGEKFAAKYKLLDHIKNAHDDTAYPCDDCKKTFIGKRKLKNHRESHKTIECFKCKNYIPKNSRASHKCNKKEYLCTTCDYKSDQKSNLKKHMQTQNKEAILQGVHYHCSQCDKQVMTKKHLKTHIESIHKGVHYYCIKCENKLLRRNNILRYT